MQRDILDEMVAIADAMGPSVACSSLDVPASLDVRKSAVPSPRGIQDMMFEFPCTPSESQAYGSSEGEVPYKVEDMLSHDKQVEPPYEFSAMPQNPAGTVVHISQPAPPPVVVPPSMFEQREITPWNEAGTCAKAPAGLGNVDPSIALTPELTSPSSVDLSKDCFSFVPVDDERDLSWGTNITAPLASGRKTESGSGSSKTPSSKLPPTAKSILERRERAIREGRRHEARLNPEERRILRRLRNRESAERCAKRKNEQAAELSWKIVNLEKENSSLQMVVSSYREQIAKIEQLLMMQQR